MGTSTDRRYDVIVIGSGLGGLSCALHFAKLGFHVLVLEKQPKVGGYCQNYVRGDYHFDVSLHILSAMNEGGGLYRLLEYLEVVDKLTIVEHAPMFTSVFPDREYDLPSGEGPFGEYLKSLFPHEGKGIDRFIDIVKRVVGDNADLIWTGEADLENFFPARYFNKTYRDLLSECFSDEKLHGLLGQLWQSTGLPNTLCAANWAAEVFGSHFLSGNYYIRGGGQELSLAMARTLREAGSVVKTASLVTRILTEDRRAHGVELESGERYFAPIVVSNAGPVQTYFSLIGKEHLAAPYIYKLNNMKPSCSLLTLYIGLDCPARDVGVCKRTTFVNRGYDNHPAYQSAMSEAYDRTDYVISDYTEESGVNHPPGHGIIQVLEVADGKAWTEIPREAYLEKKKQVTDIILKKVFLRYPKLEGRIRVLEMGTPRTMKLATRNPWGSVYGWAQTPDQADDYRFSVTSIFKGLYFTGAWCRGGGGGYMGAVVNGRVACRNILAREGIEGVEMSIHTDKKTLSRPRVADASEAYMNHTGFSKEVYDFVLDECDISEAGEISSEACIRFLSKSADRYVRDRSDLLRSIWPELSDADELRATFFQMRFLFIPFVSVQSGDTVTVEVEFEPRGRGKGEFTQNVILDRAGKKLANAGGRALIRKI